jgi:hypothetical protein
MLADGTPLDHENPAGILIVPDNNGATANAGWNLLATLGAFGDFEKYREQLLSEMRTIAGLDDRRPTQDADLIRFVMAPPHEE